MRKEKELRLGLRKTKIILFSILVVNFSNSECIKADGITNINKKLTDRKPFGSISSAVNSASRYENVTDQGSAIFNSITTGHIFGDGVKRTATEFITDFAKQNDLKLKLDGAGLQDLTKKLSTGVDEGGVRYTTEELSGILFEQ